jgi:peptidoglycan/xylan/chitin deacetylase (PgdA/CDA1 family)
LNVGMPGRWSVTAAAIASLALLAGCAGGDDGARRDEYVARGNEICRALAREFAELGVPPPPGTRRRALWELQAQQLAQRAYGRLEALEPPDELRAEHDRLTAAVRLNREHLRLLRNAAAANARELAEGVEDGPAQREFQDLTAAIERDAQIAGERMRALGWEDCALLAG